MPPARIPGPPFPIVEAFRLFTDSFNVPMNWYRRYGRLVDINSAHGGAIAAFGPEYNRQVFANTADFYTIDADTFPFKLPEGTALHRLWNNGLLQMNGERHDRQRRIMMPALHKQQIEQYRTLMIAEADRRLGVWRAGETRDVLSEMRGLTAAIAIRAFMGMDPDTDGGALHRVFSHWAALIQSPASMAVPLAIPGSPFHRLLRLSDEVEQALAALLAHKRETRSGGAAQDGLSALINAQDEDGTRLTDQEIMGQIGTFYIAGHETTASALTWALLLLAQFPDVCANLVEEIGPLNGNAPTPEQTEQMPLLDAVLNETLRLFPPLPFVVRSARVPFELDGVALPARVGVMLSAFVTHRLPEIYADAAQFLPDRWAQLSPSPYEYIPFSAGPRRCLGAVFAMAEMKIILPMILSRCRLVNPPGAKVDYAASIFVAPRGGLPMEIHPQDGKFARTEIGGNIRSVVEL